MRFRVPAVITALFLLLAMTPLDEMLIMGLAMSAGQARRIYGFIVLLVGLLAMGVVEFWLVQYQLRRGKHPFCRWLKTDWERRAEKRERRSKDDAET